jgi:hypothetical protein
VERRVLEDGAIACTTPEGEAHFRIAAQGATGAIVEGRFIGHGSLELAGAIQREMTPILEQNGRSIVFADWWDMTGYDSTARVELTAWMAKMRPRMSAFHVLVRSRLVAMGVSVANLALGGWIRSYSLRPPFLGAMQAEVTRMKREQRG